MNTRREVAALVLAASTLAACGRSDQAAAPVAAAPQSSTVMITAPLTPESLATGVKFYEPALPAFVKSTRGLAGPESFGRWSIGKLVLVDFTGPLPEEFILQMVLGGFGPNVGADLQVVVGAESKLVRIKSDLMQMQSYELRIRNPDRAETIALIVPAPTSPQATGKAANDPRMLGVAIQSMAIKPLPAAPDAKK